MSEELPREEGLPEASEASDWWIWNLFSARTDEATPREDTLRVCATCRRSLDKLNFSRTQWNKKQVGVSRCLECVSSDLEVSERWTTEAEADVPREQGGGWAAAAARRRARMRRNEDYDAEAAERRPAQRLNKEERTVLCCLVLGILLYFCCVVVAFAALADVPSGCAVALIMVAFALSFKSGEKENRCRLRAALVIHVLGLLLLVVAMVLLAMKTHRVMSLTPDPTCEPWAGSCQEGGQRSDGRTECSDCSDEVSCVDVSAAGLWWSERGARYFPASEKYGRYWGWGRTRRLNGCGLPQEPSKEETNGSFGAKGGEEQISRWEEAKETGDCRPLFTSQTKCEEYWGRWQDAWRGEWCDWLIGGLFFQALLLLCNIGLMQRRTRKSPVDAQARPLPLGPPRPQRQQSDVQCSICLGPYIERAWTKCNHSFCRKCITEVCRTNPPTNRAPCPFCRRPVLLGELTRLETTPMLANEAAQPVRDPQPESGVDAALGDAFTSQGRTNTISS